MIKKQMILFNERTRIMDRRCGTKKHNRRREHISVIRRFKTASPVAKASMALLFANLVLKGLSLISGPIFTRIMSEEQYGIVSTFVSWESLLTVIITLNLSAGVFNNGMMDFKEDRDSFEFSLLTVSSLMAIIGFCVFLLFRRPLLNLFEFPEIAVDLMFLKFLFVPAYSYWSGRQRYEYKYRALASITVVSAVLSMMIGLFGVLYVDDSNAAITRIIAMEGVSIAIGIVFFIILCFRARFRPNLQYCKYALKFNVPLIPHYLSMYVLSGSDRIMITKMINASATAVYSVAYTVASVIMIVWQSIDASFSPWIYEKLDASEKAPVYKLTTGIALLFAGLCLGCTLLAPEIMMILAPASYSSGIYVIPPVSAGVFFTTLYSVYMRIELFYKQTGFATIATTIAAVLNIILNYIFIDVFGAVAAGYTTMTCYALLALFHYLNVRRKGYSDIINNKAFLGISMVVTIGSVIISLLYSYLILRVSLIAVATIIAICKRKAIIKLPMIRKK